MGNRVSAGRGSEADLTDRTECGWVMFRECGELLSENFLYS